MFDPNDKKPYWYFRFETYFFSDMEIKQMKHVPMYGYQFVVIYLELCSLATRNGGHIYIKNKAISEAIAMLAVEIGEPAELTNYAFRYFIENGFVKIEQLQDDAKFDFPNLKNKIGKSSKEADRQRLRRAEQAETEKLNCIETPLLGNKRADDGDGVYKNIFLSFENKRWIYDRYEDAERIINEASAKKEFGSASAEKEDFSICLAAALNSKRVVGDKEKIKSETRELLRSYEK